MSTATKRTCKITSLDKNVLVYSNNMLDDLRSIPGSESLCFYQSNIYVNVFFKLLFDLSCPILELFSLIENVYIVLSCLIK